MAFMHPPQSIAPLGTQVKWCQTYFLWEFSLSLTTMAFPASAFIGHWFFRYCLSKGFSDLFFPFRSVLRKGQTGAFFELPGQVVDTAAPHGDGDLTKVELTLLDKFLNFIGSQINKVLLNGDAAILAV